MSKQTIVWIAACVLGTTLATPAQADEVVVEGADAYHYRVRSAAAQELLGGDDVIARRSDTFTFEGGQIPRPVFAVYDDAEALDRLRERAVDLLGEEALSYDEIDIDVALSLQTESGIAWVAKHSGAMSIKSSDYPRGISEIDSAEEAVESALVALAETGFQLDEQVTLDVVDVSVLQRAAWVENGQGEVRPVLYEGRDGDLITQFKTSYKVTFGRRYAGVPFLGSALVVRLDSHGHAAAILHHWRDIVEQGDIETIDVAEAIEEQTAGFPDEFDVQSVACGYVEANPVGYGQESPGVGCRMLGVDASKVGEMDSDRVEWINLSVDPEADTLHGFSLELVPELEDPPPPPPVAFPPAGSVEESALWIEDFESGALGAPWTSWGNAGWFTQSSIAYEQSSAAESGNIDDNEDSYLETVADFPTGGDVSFWHTGDTEGYWDFFEFRIDGILQFEQSGDWDWTYATYPVAAGLHTFEWRYLKDGSVSRGADTVWIDDVQMYGATP